MTTRKDVETRDGRIVAHDEKWEHPNHGKRQTRMSRLVTISMSDTDAEILEWLTAFLGTSRTEAARTAIRSFAGQMKTLNRDLRKDGGIGTGTDRA